MYNPADAQKSIRAFEKFTAPTLRHALGAVVVKTMERHESQYEKDMDFACIDGVIVDTDGWTIRYASRVQFGTNYETFTVRRTRPSGENTEYAKLCKAWRLQKPMPRYHVHTYVNKGEQFATVAITETFELLRYIKNHQNQWRTAPTGETFYYIPFAEVAAQVYRVSASGHIEKKKAA